MNVSLLLSQRPGLQENTLCGSLRNISHNLEVCWAPDLHSSRMLLVARTVEAPGVKDFTF